MTARAARLLVLAACFAAAAPARAACPDMAAVARFADAILDRRSPPPHPGLSLADARCAQDRLVAFLAQPWGDAVGFKVALTTAEPVRDLPRHPARCLARAPAGPLRGCADGRGGVAGPHRARWHRGRGR